MLTEESVMLRARPEHTGETRCDRCGGRMIPQEYLYGVETFWEWKCMSCGEVIDPLIKLNRTRQGLGIE
jgi:DNA-directed RNA polymerase subunit RPC12/RpoP